METMDLSEVFARLNAVKTSSPKYRAKAACLKQYSCWKGVPADAFTKLARLGVVLDEIVAEGHLDAVALRCWIEMQRQLGISPCVVMSEMNDRGIPVACEVDVGNAIMMFALSRASGGPAACLDWNNNYAEEDDKCILFHCGPVPQSMMQGQGQVSDHSILANAVGEGCGFGCNTGRIAPGPFSYGSLLTQDGKLCCYLGEGRFTKDPVPADFFGCAGVAEIECLQDALQTIGYLGHRHHTSVTPGYVADPVAEVMDRYLDYDITTL
jgi:L-fucose isomerase-like protein